jgi:hypothetical protein
MRLSIVLSGGVTDRRADMAPKTDNYEYESAGLLATHCSLLLLEHSPHSPSIHTVIVVEGRLLQQSSSCHCETSERYIR